jgi:hypothetical protein
MLAKVINDNAGCLNVRGALWFFASELAPTGGVYGNSATNTWGTL